eukprot:SAG31_NODE_13647_length_855_cov_1.740741_1_plen_35_part_10
MHTLGGIELGPSEVAKVERIKVGGELTHLANNPDD